MTKAAQHCEWPGQLGAAFTYHPRCLLPVLQAEAAGRSGKHAHLSRSVPVTGSFPAAPGMAEIDRPSMEGDSVVIPAESSSVPHLLCGGSVCGEPAALA